MLECFRVSSTSVNLCLAIGDVARELLQAARIDPLSFSPVALSPSAPRRIAINMSGPTFVV